MCIRDSINTDLVMMQMARQQITQTKPIYVGFSVLELSKITMYEFHYDHIMKKYGSNAQLLYTDTDSFMYHIKTKDLYRDMADDLDTYDTSNFDKSTPCTARPTRRSSGSSSAKQVQ